MSMQFVRSFFAAIAIGNFLVAIATATENEPAESNDVAAPTENVAPASSESEAVAEKKSAGIQALTEMEQQKLLQRRIPGGMGNSFRQFSNMFLAFSRLQLGVGVGLMTLDKEIAKTPLMSPFPASYEPTLREFLDSLALQTSSEWKYDPTSKFFKSDVEHKEPVKGLAFFEFAKAERKKPYTIDLAEGWKTVDRGNWVMHVPPGFPVGMDIYEMGDYSPKEGEANDAFRNEIRSAVALEWAQRVKEGAAQDELKPAKVGDLDAVHFEAMIPSQLGKDIRWRQWVFMGKEKCYFIVSTILPEKDAEIFPDVEKMLGSFKLVDP